MDDELAARPGPGGALDVEDTHHTTVFVHVPHLQGSRPVSGNSQYRGLTPCPCGVEDIELLSRPGDSPCLG